MSKPGRFAPVGPARVALLVPAKAARSWHVPCDLQREWWAGAARRPL